nr:hypothetical protein [uncultured Carboxylicivirga sp.]
MPEIQFPQSDNARSQFLKKCINTLAANSVEKATLVMVPPEVIDKANVLLPQFDQKLSVVNSLLSQRSKEVSEKQVSLDALNVWLRDFWEVLRRRTSRLNHSAQVLTHYYLPLSGATPELSKQKDMLDIAQRVVDGDATAVLAGYPAMINPSASELKEVLDKAWKEVGDVPMADEVYDKAQEEIAGLRVQMDDIIREIYEYLNFNLRKKDAASKRRILQNYGFTYRYLKDEPAGDKPE